jgi:hypothetical protein
VPLPFELLAPWLPAAPPAFGLVPWLELDVPWLEPDAPWLELACLVEAFEPFPWLLAGEGLPAPWLATWLFP